YNPGVFTQTFISPDLVDEVRIIVAPADAEFGRGSGQVQMATRSGTNEYRGSVFWANRNSVWDAATFNNNFNNLGKDYLNRNQNCLTKRTILDPMPLPNNFEAAGGVDGLNTARYKWIRRRYGSDTLSGGSEGDVTNRDQINLRIDHQFNANNKLTLAGTREH